MKKLLAVIPLFATSVFAEITPPITTDTLLTNSETWTSTTSFKVIQNATLTVSGSDVVFSLNNNVSQYALGLGESPTSTGSLVIKDGASVVFSSTGLSTGNIQVNPGSNIDIQSTGGTITVNKIAMASPTAKLTISREEGIISQKYVAPTLTLPSAGTVVLNATQSFCIDLRSNVAVKFDINNGSVLKVADWTFGGNNAGGASFCLDDFTSNSVFLATDSGISYSLSSNNLTVSKGTQSQTISIVDWNKKAIEGLSLVETTGGYFLSTVPEPAEWAAIFGALALGIALLKRRNFKK